MLFVTHKWKNNHFGGRQSYSRTLLKVLKKIPNTRPLEIYQVNPYKNIKLKDKIFSLKTDYLTSDDVDKICKIIEKKKINIVLIDCSSFGYLCKRIKSISNKIKIITIHHHIEFIFYYKLFLNGYNLKHLILSIKMYFIEKLSSKYSDAQIYFTNRDKLLAKKNFEAKNSNIFPVSIDPKKNINKKSVRSLKKFNPYFLFVGGAHLKPNYYGIKWFIKKVLPFVKTNLIVIGSGYDSLANKVQNKNIFFLGKVENLSIYYKNSQFVITPIFSGSGMKTKVAEAFSYGKTVFGTTESSIGYENNFNLCMISCNNSEDFIKNIKNYKKIVKNSSKIKKVFETNYSYTAMKKNFYKLIKSLK
tara:strand:- start:1583 stop:2659 length:1077 start_codon:yes stop_codon:yes gene_type:complete